MTTADALAKKIWLSLLLLGSVAFTTPAGEWTIYDDCDFNKNSYADGDSFSIEVKRPSKQEYIFRLYFVDTPESDSRIPERIADQAAYWDISEYQTVYLGEDAATFAKRWLKQSDLRVYTQHKDAMGASTKKRYYAMVQDKNTEEFLSMALVRHGLARIYGMDVKLEDGTSAKSYNRKLAEAEKLAKAEKVGGWMLDKPIGSAVELAEIQMEKAKNSIEHPHRRRVTTPLRVYSLKAPYKAVGVLKIQMEIQLLGPAQPGMIRVRFRPNPERIIEAQCKTVDIKTRALVVLKD